MTPTVSAALIYSRDHLPLSNKLRKPIVEKMRRERINSSMEKLKSLLGGEFLKQQPDSRQEKADILEMTLQFLKQQQQQQSHNNSVCSTADDEGYSRCVQEAVSFLSQCGVQTPSQRRLLRHFLTMQPSMKNSTSVLQLSSSACSTSSKEEPPASSALWRPW
ncbi:transcription factor HES-5-like [Astyanax mexicanus]|uniref:transcription factor HES-5-like n=1 Tax=Astyanax mexicanus TaxID=7994 RepID=UPI0020CB0F05|nr:transcription factor HES-5-like [Astyanax mexicanus]